MFRKIGYKLVGIIIILISTFILLSHVNNVYAEETLETSVTRLKGDFNGDGKKDVTDLLIMLRHIAASKNEAIKQKYPKWYKENQKEEMDLNHDSKVDVTDCVALQRHIAANKDEKIAFKHPEWLIKDVKPEALKLNLEKVKISLAENKEVQLIPYIASTGEEIFTDLTWESSNPEVATVNNSGKVVGISVGTSIIKVRARNTIEATCEVTVEQGTIKIAPEAITIDKTDLELELKQDSMIKLQYKITPSNANTDIEVEWISNNPEVVVVDEQGKITPKAEGIAIITAKTANGKTATCNIVVKKTNEKTEIYPEELINDTPEIKIILIEDAYAEMKTQIKPSDANIGTEITYSSSDTSIVQVDKNGILRGVKEGTCTVTATTENGKTAQSTVIVEKGSIAPQSIKINESGPITLTGKNTTKLTATITPDNANVDTGLKWESSNSSIASVDNNGVVTANQEGNCTITVTTENGKTADISVNVEVEEIVPTKVDIEVKGSSSLPNMNINETAQMQAIITPSNANTHTNITWTSSNEKVAVVNEQGLVQAKMAGDCTITATTGNGKSATYAIKVIKSSEPVEILPTGVSIVVVKGNGTLPKMKINETVEMQAVIVPDNATNKSVTWESSNEKVAVVNQQGIVTAKSEGYCDIKATTVNGKSVFYRIEVIASSEPVEILPTKVEVVATGGTDLPNIKVDETIQMQATITPNNATNKTITWTSSNDNIAVVNDKGVVRARAVGLCKIIATTHNGKSASYALNIKANEVKPQPIYPSSVSINTGGQTVLEVNKTKQLSAVITPSNANTDTRLEWKSSNTSIAVVNSNGVVTALKEGTCTITVTTANGKTNTCTITVKNNMISPTGISIKAEGTTKLNVNKSVKLNATITPSNANANMAITWKSSNEKVATVNTSGLVQAKGVGKCTITATTANNISTTCEIEVVDTVAPKVEIKSSYSDYIITGGTTVTYQINIVEDSLKSFDKTKVKLTGSLKDEATLKVAGSGKAYTATVVVPNKIGRLGITVDTGAAVDQGNNKSTKVQYHNMEDYVFTLNETTANNQITATVGVSNSFYIKSYDFYLNDTKKSGGRTTNEYTYTGVKTGSTYKIKVKVNVYKDKETDNTVSGWLEKNVKVNENKGVEVHFINVTDKDYAGDCIFVKTQNGKTIMIDTGPNQLEKDGKVTRKNKAATIDRYLRKDKKGKGGKNLVTASSGIIKVDYLIITHSHLDHAGGFRVLTGVNYKAGSPGYTINANNEINGDKVRYEFGKIILGCNATDYKADEKVEADSQRRNKAIYCYAKNTKKLIRVTAGNVLKIDNIVLNIFNPYDDADVPGRWLLSNPNSDGEKTTGVRQAVEVMRANGKGTTTLTKPNNNSIVTKLICGSRKVLLTGDAEFYTEEILLGIPAKQVVKKDSKKASGLAIHSTNGADKKDTETMTSHVSLVYDLIKNKYDAKCTTLSALENKYKLSRLTAKDVSAQVLKKGHHGYSQTTSLEFLKAVKPNKIVSTGIKHVGSTISCVDISVDYRIKKYYKSDNNGTSEGEPKSITASNWKNNVFGTYTHGSFYIYTDTGTSWDYSDPYKKAK